MPVNALSAGESNTEQQTLNDLNTENSNSTYESNATSTEVATDSNASEDTSISDISSNDIDSSEEKLNNNISLQSDNTEDEEEPSTDNWELGLVFYDSTVDGGKTPLTSIDWDASDGSYLEGTPRVITVQINYKNTNTVTTYQPGELKIKIPNLMYNQNTIGSNSDSNLEWETIVGANDSTHTGYDWSFKGVNGRKEYDALNSSVSDIVFSNANIIEEKSNFEGSIQIAYTLTPATEGMSYGSDSVEKYEEECTHTYYIPLYATIDSIKLTSNTINFNYQRTYIHPWKKIEGTIKKTVEKINSCDLFPSNYNDFLWVKYKFRVAFNADMVQTRYPYIKLLNKEIQDTFPEKCCVLDSQLKILSPDNNGIYHINKYTDSYSNTYNYEVYVGYPKSEYDENAGNINITNTAYLYGQYANSDEIELLAQDTCNFNLADYKFSYSGELYGIKKTTSNQNMYYQEIIADSIYNRKNYNINATAYYSGHPMTVKIGDDLLYATDNNGENRKLEDDDYYFTQVIFPEKFKNAHDAPIESGKYNIELWVRYKGEHDYTLYDSFTNGNGGNSEDIYGNFIYYYRKGIAFPKDKKVVGFYFIIYDMNESLYNFQIEPEIKFCKKEIPQTGELHNFSYLQVFFRDNSNNLMVQNEPDISSYSNFITKENIAKFDRETYGMYLQRSSCLSEWTYQDDFTLMMASRVSKKINDKYVEDKINEKFTGSFSTSYQWECVDYNPIYNNEYDKKDFFQGFVLYDLLPLGMELNSTKEEIAESLNIQIDYIYTKEAYKILDSSFKEISKEMLKNIIDNNTIINIKKNWNNTGRTKIEVIVDLKDNPILFVKDITVHKNPYNQNSRYTTFSYNYKYSISYDNYIEYGKVYKNELYGDYLNKTPNQELAFTNKDIIDINENNDTNDYLAYSYSTVNINNVVSTHQDVTKYVQTDKNNYSTGTVKASPDSEYTYKLRVRTGQNDVTNLVIYDSVEEYAQDKDGNIVPAYGTKKHWNGSFLGIDTSYAEAKGYVVKPYYSENKLAGNLYNEDGSINTDWKEYSDSVDKGKVKSLAFEYLNKDDETQKAVLPANSQTYVLVKMQAPPEENRKVLAYNGCRTQWNALDDYDRPVDFITGINSNIVKVSLSDYYDLTVNKVWNDENNKWGLRPDSVDIILKKDGTEVERKQITKDNLSVTFTDLLVEDSDRYTIEEESLSLYSSTIEYNELEDCYEVTNTLKNDIFKDISGTKTWVGDKESKRPDSITIKLLKDGEVYRTTTTGAEKNWKYSFTKVPIYNADETRCIYSVEEESVDKYTVQYAGNGKGLTIKFNSQFKTESVSYDYVEIYYKQDGQTYKLGRWGGTALAGQTVNVPTNDFYLYWRTDGSGNNYYGFSIDSIEPVDATTSGTKASLPNYSVTELTGNNYPETAHNPYPNSQNLMWHYTGNFTSDVPAEGLLNIVNTYEGTDAVGLSFVKAIEGTDEAFEKLQLEKDALYKFQVSMKNRETNDIIYVPIDNKNTATVSEVPIGTYEITEKDDMYFDFVSMEALNSVEGVTFEKVGNDYVLTITENASEEEMLHIKVNNKIEPDRPYEDKKERVNLFDWTSDENSEEVNLLSRIVNFFKN